MTSQLYHWEKNNKSHDIKDIYILSLHPWKAFHNCFTNAMALSMQKHEWLHRANLYQLNCHVFPQRIWQLELVRYFDHWSQAVYNLYFRIWRSSDIGTTGLLNAGIGLRARCLTGAPLLTVSRMHCGKCIENGLKLLWKRCPGRPNWTHMNLFCNECAFVFCIVLCHSPVPWKPRPWVSAPFLSGIGAAAPLPPCSILYSSSQTFLEGVTSLW